MSTINLPNNNAVINNLTVNGTLTASGFAPSGNLSLSGTLGVTGLSTLTTVDVTGAGNGLVVSNNADIGGLLSIGTASTTEGQITLANTTNANTVTVQSASGGTTTSYTLALPPAVPASSNSFLAGSTGGALSWLPPCGYFEAQSTSGKVYNQNSSTAVEFDTINYNTFSSSVLGISGTGNSIFTNATSGIIYVTISCALISASATSVTGWQFYIQKSSVGTEFGYNTISNSGETIITGSITFTLSLASSEHFSVILYSLGAATTLGNNGSYPVTFSIKQVY